jgi:tetratricopeptide (TPR) repeat protein
MRTASRFPLSVVGFCLATIIICNAQSISAKAEFDLGVAAYKLAKYEEAIRHFKQAVVLDPTFVPAHLHLASAYAQQYIPGVDIADNDQMAQRAIAQYEQVLALSPTYEQEVSSLKGIAHLYLNMKQFERAITEVTAQPPRRDAKKSTTATRARVSTVISRNQLQLLHSQRDRRLVGE